LVRDAFFRVYEEGDTICSGLCPSGADRFAVILSKENNIPNLWFPAEWDKYGRGAGFRRNTDIAIKSDVLIACVAKDRTGGTEDTIRKFEKLHNYKAILV
jgi:hypothetical protein